MNESEILSIVYGVFTFLALVLIVFWVMFPILVWQHLRELNKHAVDIQNLLVDVSKDLRLMANLAIPETPAVRTVSTAPKPPPPPPPDVESSSQTFQFKCDFCEAIIEYEPEQAGAIAPCPNCGNEINLP